MISTKHITTKTTTNDKNNNNTKIETEKGFWKFKLLPWNNVTTSTASASPNKNNKNNKPLKHPDAAKHNAAYKKLQHERNALRHTQNKYFKEQNHLKRLVSQLGKDLKRTSRLDEQYDKTMRQMAQLKRRIKFLQERIHFTDYDVEKIQEQMDALAFWYRNKPLHMPHIPKVDYSIPETKNGIPEHLDFVTQLGQGSYGWVWKAIHNKPSSSADSVQKEGAVKCLKKSMIYTKGMIEQVNREIEILSRHGHDNIIGFVDVIHAAQYIYVILDLAWTDVHALLKHADMALPDRREIVLGLVQALAHLHVSGFAHLDVKPENILLDHYNPGSSSSSSSSSSKQHHQGEIGNGLSRRAVKLCDFGLAQPAGKLLRDMTLGTPGFFGPEMILFHKFEGCKADMWSIGACLLEIIVGAFPDGWLHYYRLHEDDPETFESGLFWCLEGLGSQKSLLKDPHLYNLLMKHLLVQPDDRMTAEQVLKHPWFQADSK